MGEATQPLPVITGTAALVAVTREAIAEIRKTQELIRQDISRRGPLIELVMITTRLAEMEDTFRRGTTQQLTRAALEGPPLAAVPAVPAQRGHRRAHRRRSPGPGQAQLFPVPGFVLAAFAVLRHALRHSTAAHAIGAHGALKAALAATAVTAGGTALVVGAVVTLAPHSGSAGPYGASGPAPAASAYAASPIPTSSLITVTRPRTGTADVRRARLAQGGILPVLPQPSASWSSPSSQPSGPSQPSASASSSPAGPAVLGGVPTAIDLSGGAPVVITLTASGGGWVAWKVGTTGTDLVFSKTGGVLAAGGFYQLTVSLAAPLDGNATQTFDVNGQQVTVTLPGPVATPSPAVTGTDTPSPVPTSS